MILYLHGFRSSPQSFKARMIAEKLRALGLDADYYCPQLPASPREAVALASQIARRFAPDELTLIGSSLGGFWAYHFASRYALKCVLLNPCMHPAATLGPYVGLVENLYTDEQGRMNRSDLLQYDKYRPVGEVECVVLHEKGDELIPYQESVANFTDKARLILIEGGSHRFENLELAIGEIRSLVGNQEQG